MLCGHTKSINLGYDKEDGRRQTQQGPTSCVGGSSLRLRSPGLGGVWPTHWDSVSEDKRVIGLFLLLPQKDPRLHV